MSAGIACCHVIWGCRQRSSLKDSKGVTYLTWDQADYIIKQNTICITLFCLMMMSAWANVR